MATVGYNKQKSDILAYDNLFNYVISDKKIVRFIIYNLLSSVDYAKTYFLLSQRLIKRWCGILHYHTSLKSRVSSVIEPIVSPLQMSNETNELCLCQAWCC